MQKKWKIKETDNKIVNDLAESLGVSRSIAHLLVIRGVTTFDEAKQFFRPDFSGKIVAKKKKIFREIPSPQKCDRKYV